MPCPGLDDCYGSWLDIIKGRFTYRPRLLHNGGLKLFSRHKSGEAYSNTVCGMHVCIHGEVWDPDTGISSLEGTPGDCASPYLRRDEDGCLWVDLPAIPLPEVCDEKTNPPVTAPPYSQLDDSERWRVAGCGPCITYTAPADQCGVIELVRKITVVNALMDRPKSDVIFQLDIHDGAGTTEETINVFAADGDVDVHSGTIEVDTIRLEAGESHTMCVDPFLSYRSSGTDEPFPVDPGRIRVCLQPTQIIESVEPMVAV